MTREETSVWLSFNLSYTGFIGVSLPSTGQRLLGEGSGRSREGERVSGAMGDHALLPTDIVRA